MGLLLGIAIRVPTFAASGTKVINSWRSSGPLPEFNKILVVTVFENYLIRQYLEDEMETLLASSGISGIKGHMVLPPRDEVSESELKQRLKDTDLEGVLVIRLKDIRNETDEVVSSPYIPPVGYTTLGPYWANHVQMFHTTSHVTARTVVRVECNLYDVESEALLWSSETDTVYSKDFQKLAKEYARALVSRLRKDNVIAQK